MTVAKCIKCGGTATADTYDTARQLINHAVGLSRGIKCGDNYNCVEEIKPTTQTPPIIPTKPDTPKPDTLQPDTPPTTQTPKHDTPKPDTPPTTQTPKPDTPKPESSFSPKKSKKTKSSV